MIFVTVSTGHYNLLIETCNRLSKFYEFYGQVGSTTVTPVFPYYRMAPPEKLISDMMAAEIVVTHGGTGVLTDLYRMRKPCIVVPKQLRFGENDLQVDLACRWARLGMGILCMDPRDLRLAIEEFKKSTFRFPQFPALGTFLRQRIQDDTCAVDSPVNSSPERFEFQV